MDSNSIWDVFQTTGDPVCRLLYRASLSAGGNTENIGTD